MSKTRDDLDAIWTVIGPQVCEPEDEEVARDAHSRLTRRIEVLERVADAAREAEGEVSDKRSGVCSVCGTWDGTHEGGCWVGRVVSALSALDAIDTEESDG